MEVTLNNAEEGLNVRVAGRIDTYMAEEIEKMRLSPIEPAEFAFAKPSPTTEIPSSLPVAEGTTPYLPTDRFRRKKWLENSVKIRNLDGRTGSIHQLSPLRQPA